MHWYTPARVEGHLTDAIAALAEMRVTFKPTSVRPTYEAVDDNGHPLVMKEIGMIKVHDGGEITALAYEGLRAEEIRVLLGSAEIAMSTTPRTRDGWLRRRNNGKPRWEHVVQIPVDESDERVALIVARDIDRCAREMAAERLDAAIDELIEAQA